MLSYTSSYIKFLGGLLSVTKSANSRKAYHKRWWKRNKDRINTTLRCKPEYRFQAMKLRCKKNRVRFDISFKNFLAKLKGGCYYCGANIMKEVGCGMDRSNNAIRSYTARNLVACCSDCNKIKSDRLTKNEMLVAMKAVVKYRRRNK